MKKVESRSWELVKLCFEDGLEMAVCDSGERLVFIVQVFLGTEFFDLVELYSTDILNWKVPDGSKWEETVHGHI